MIKKYLKKKRIFKKISGSFEKPRLSVFRSNKHFYAQVIDDIEQKTLVSYSSLNLKKDKYEKINLNISTSKNVGIFLGEKMLNKNIEKIVFDKNGRKYHGKIKMFADTLREKGIQF